MNLDAYLGNKLYGRSVFITGHTGFKGSWLIAWLHRYGCNITGYALAPETEPSLFVLAQLKEKLVKHHVYDINDSESLEVAIKQAEPELVIHLAAQSLVRRGYRQPVNTWSTNVMGTVNLLEAVRACASVRVVLVVTTDKCYDNHEWIWGYRETDSLGGYDPYSASKAATELVVQSYRKSFFSDGGPLVASARAGNVIGGGDWSENRLIPDVARAVSTGKVLKIRNPGATRPWQHVLDCLQGYLLLAANLLDGNADLARAFNFGPAISDNVSVEQMLSKLQNYWPELVWQVEKESSASVLHESGYLYLDSSLARQKIGWKPCWDLESALEKTASWYRMVLANQTQALILLNKQLDEYMSL